MSKKTTGSAVAKAVVDLIESGLDAKKCRRCGKMAGVIESAEQAFEVAEDPSVRSMVDKVAELRKRTLKQASGNFGCGGCWGAKARKELSKAFKAPKPKKSKTKTASPVLIEAAGTRPFRRDGKGTLGFEVVDGMIKCLHYSSSGDLTHVVTGRDAIAIAATITDAGLLGRPESAAYLGWELARAEAALASGEPYAPNPWPMREEKRK